jgi:hypothetical protein
MANYQTALVAVETLSQVFSCLDSNVVENHNKMQLTLQKVLNGIVPQAASANSLCLA